MEQYNYLFQFNYWDPGTTGTFWQLFRSRSNCSGLIIPKKFPAALRAAGFSGAPVQGPLDPGMLSLPDLGLAVCMDPLLLPFRGLSYRHCVLFIHVCVVMPCDMETLPVAPLLSLVLKPAWCIVCAMPEPFTLAQ